MDKALALRLGLFVVVKVCLLKFLVGVLDFLAADLHWLDFLLFCSLLLDLSVNLHD